MYLQTCEVVVVVKEKEQERTRYRDTEGKKERQKERKILNFGTLTLSLNGKTMQIRALF